MVKPTSKLLETFLQEKKSGSIDQTLAEFCIESGRNMHVAKETFNLFVLANKVKKTLSKEMCARMPHAMSEKDWTYHYGNEWVWIGG